MENVWDYPRPPAVEPCTRRVRIAFGGVRIVDSTRALRVLETSHPPAIYVPPADVSAVLRPAAGHRTFCEWKGWASYFDVVTGDHVAAAAAWTYHHPDAGYVSLTDHVAFYPGRMDGCWLGDDLVTAQPGDFYGGWLTPDITGPVKGPPGTSHW